MLCLPILAFINQLNHICKKFYTSEYTIYHSINFSSHFSQYCGIKQSCGIFGIAQVWYWKEVQNAKIKWIAVKYRSKPWPDKSLPLGQYKRATDRLLRALSHLQALRQTGRPACLRSNPIPHFIAKTIVYGYSRKILRF